MNVEGFARGLISLLAAKDRGKGLSQAADYLQPTLDVTELLAIQKRRAILGGPTPILAGPNTVEFMRVPAGKVWRLHHFEFDVDLVAGDTLISTHLIIVPSEGADTPGMGLSMTESKEFNGPLSVVLLANFQPGFLVPAGSLFMVHWDATLAAGPPNGIVRLYVDELEI